MTITTATTLKHAVQPSHDTSAVAQQDPGGSPLFAMILSQQAAITEIGQPASGLRADDRKSPSSEAVESEIRDVNPNQSVPDFTAATTVPWLPAPNTVPSNPSDAPEIRLTNSIAAGDADSLAAAGTELAPNRTASGATQQLPPKTRDLSGGDPATESPIRGEAEDPVQTPIGQTRNVGISPVQEAQTSEPESLPKGKEPPAPGPLTSGIPQSAGHVAPAEIRQFALESRVGSPRWASELHEHVAVMVNSGARTAELRLNPEEMGPIEIHIDFSAAQPTVTISVQNAETRSALDAALPRLREMLADSGLALGESSVEHRQSGSQDNPGRDAADLPRFPPREPATATGLPSSPIRSSSLVRLVDTYA